MESAPLIHYGEGNEFPLSLVRRGAGGKVKRLHLHEPENPVKKYLVERKVAWPIYIFIICTWTRSI